MFESHIFSKLNPVQYLYST
uniref:Uncharacterized protein n=1 Tax=Anguilla anguilla TaxID=7936 RepID=A0A0E9SGH4_ANGAN